jgi:hypothetical protein
MTIDADLIEGIKIGFLIGVVFGVGLMLLVAWAIARVSMEDDK